MEGIRFDPDRCPTCSAPPECRIDSLEGRAWLVAIADGVFDWVDGTEILWDSAMPARRLDDEHVTLQCAELHEWLALES